MKRKIIEIDEELCNGCGECIVGCSEGALQIIDGKAKLVKEDFCDGFGDCVGTCPTGALQVIERDAVPFNEEATKEYLRETQGEEAVKKMEKAQAKHQISPMSIMGLSHGGGCPGSRQQVLKKESTKSTHTNTQNVSVIPSELEQWPVQIHLVSPRAPFFKNKEMVIMATCAPLACADVHWKYLRGRSVVIGCPKLDVTDPYVEKLAAIMSEPSIPRVIIVRQEVPCCGGLTQMSAMAKQMSGRDDLILEEHTISISGEVIGVREL